MPLHGIGDVQQALGGKAVTPQDIGAHGARHQQGGGGTQTPADRDVGVDVDFHAPNLLVQGSQHRAIGGVGHVVRAGVSLVAAGDFQPAVRFFKGDIGIQAQGAAKRVKARPKVSCGRGYTDRNSFHGISLQIL